MFVIGQLTRGERLALVVQQCLIPPTRNRQLLFKANNHLVGPYATYFGVGDPGHLLKLGAHAFQVYGEEARCHIWGNALLHGLLADIGQITLHVDIGNRAVGIRHQALGTLVGAITQRHQQHWPEQGFQKAEIGFWQTHRHRFFRHHPAGATRHRLAAGSGWLMTKRCTLHGLNPAPLNLPPESTAPAVGNPDPPPWPPSAPGCDRSCPARC